MLKAKARFQHLVNEINYKKHADISTLITDMSITLVKDKAGILPIRDFSKVQALFVGDSELYRDSLFKNQFEFTTSELKTPNSELLMIAIFTSIAAWKGSSGLSNDEIQMINGLIKRSKNLLLYLLEARMSCAISEVLIFSLQPMSLQSRRKWL
jgi:hypothetical protein